MYKATTSACYSWLWSHRTSLCVYSTHAENGIYSFTVCTIHSPRIRIAHYVRSQRSLNVYQHCVCHRIWIWKSSQYIYLCSVFEVVSMFKLRAQHSRNSEMFIFENDKVADAFKLFDALFIGDRGCCADINWCFWFLSIYDVFFLTTIQVQFFGNDRIFIFYKSYGTFH